MIFRTCQWIEGEPTRQQIREHGSDAFKCGAPVREGSPYCPEHHLRCHIQRAADNDDGQQEQSA